MPLPQVRPETISKETWQEMNQTWSSSEEVKEKIAGHSQLLFVGGALEAGVSGFLQYFDKCYHQPGQELFYLPELCVIADKSFWINKIKPKLNELGVQAIDYQSALDLGKAKK